jgi:predicted TIM-barrel fold metal-dependent hydrolase
MAISPVSAEKASGSAVAVKVVDADVHPTITVDKFADHIPEPWRTRYFKQALPMVGGLYGSVMSFSREDTNPPGGGGPGSDPDFAAHQLFVDEKVDYAVLIPMSATSNQLTNPEAETAFLSGVNTYTAESWLGKDNWHGRYKGSIAVSPADPEGAAREIERWAGHPHFVQVGMPLGSRVPFGNPRHDAIWAAATKNNLPVGFHFTTTASMNWLTPAGFPSSYLEAHALASHQAMAHVSSFVLEAVFERFPTLRLAWIETGFTWLLPLMWRLDNNWRDLGHEVPLLKRAPSEYIKEHMRFSTQALDDVTPFTDLVRVMEMVEGDRILIFSTDYPHHDTDDPNWLETRLPKAWRHRVMAENAIELYGLPRTRPRDVFDEEGAGV